MEFVRQLPRKSLFRDLIRPGWGDRSFFNSASGQSGEEWEAERKALGWVDAEIIMWFFRKFDGWRQKIITSNKRKGGLAKKPRSGVKMDADAGEEAK